MATHNNLKRMVLGGHTAQRCFFPDWWLVGINSEMRVSQPGVKLQLLGMQHSSSPVVKPE